MTRFQQELSGSLGAFWQKEAEKELAKTRADLDSGRITIDSNGVARNCIGRITAGGKPHQSRTHQYTCNSF